MNWWQVGTWAAGGGFGWLVGALVARRERRKTAAAEPSIMLCESMYHGDYSTYRCQLAFGHIGFHRGLTKVSGKNLVRTWDDENKRAWDVPRGKGGR